MADENYKRYTRSARRGIKGEAFFESIIVDYAIPHRIARQNDLGVDFLCEWTCHDQPTGLLFCAQVKSTTSETVQFDIGEPRSRNGLMKHVLTGAPAVDDRTINYWKGLWLPAFLFVVIESTSNGAHRLDCFHKRYTPILDGHTEPDDLVASRSFFRVYDQGKFLAYALPAAETGGFARDLLIDYARLSYAKGHIPRLSPNALGFWPLPGKANPDEVRVFDDFVKWNKDKITEACELTNRILKRVEPT